MRSSTGRRMMTAPVLVAVLTLAGTTDASAWTTAYGHVGADDRTLRRGCHDYPYRYVVKPLSADWILETWLRDPRGKPRGSGDFASGSDPARGRGHFGICRSTVVPGRFTIKARLSWYTAGMLPTDPPVEHQRWFKPAHFRLHR
jgi:hypothetical protein